MTLRPSRSGRDDAPPPVVYVVDDDDALRDALADLLDSAGLRACTFDSAEAFLSDPLEDAPACLILDVSLPGLNGLELQRTLIADGSDLPIVFISGHGTVPISVQALRAGAVTFLMKPFDDRALLDAVHEGLDRDRRRRTDRAAHEGLARRQGLLSAREREVMAGVVSGRSNKAIARTLGISEIMVKLHRARVMQKMEAHTLAELVRLHEQLQGSERHDT
jgi:FixJ family two-component response regulator